VDQPVQAGGHLGQFAADGGLTQAEIDGAQPGWQVGFIQRQALPKGDVLTVARIAGIQAAKRTSDLIPLCHPLALRGVDIAFEMDQSLPGVRVSVQVRTIAPTGVEMEAMAAVSVALLTVYDMAKAVDREMILTDIQVISKDGGRSGSWRRSPPGSEHAPQGESSPP
jgi:cyclic pyranopterin phosphate synthase